MRAAVFKQSGYPWAIEEHPVPTPGPGELLVKVGRCGICGTDLNMTSGKGYDFPCNSVLGHEFCGEVVELSKGIEGFNLGDIITALPATGCGECAVCKDGLDVICTQMKAYSSGYAEYALVAARTAIKLPQALSLTDGALVEPLSVGLHGLRMSHMQEGLKVLVLGAGAVGLATTFWARHLGAGTVVTASRSPRREEKALLLGAHHYVLTGQDEAERIHDALGGMPDIVFETAGVIGMLGQAINLVRPNGHVLSMGFCMAPDPVVPGLATYKQARITFSMAWTLSEFQQSVDVLDAGHVEPRDMVTNTISLDDLPAKIEELRGPHNETKVHVAPNG